MNRVTVRLPKFKLLDTDDALRAAAGSLFRSATRIMADSQANYVPVETGTLRSTGTVTAPTVQGGRVVVELGYGGPAAPYAFYVHENPRSGKTGGISPGGAKYRRWAQVGQWKYLEIPLNLQRREIAPRLARALARARRTA